MKSVQKRVHVGHKHDGLENTKTTAISQRLVFNIVFQHERPQKNKKRVIKFSRSSSAGSSHISSYQNQNRSSHQQHHFHHSPRIINIFLTVHGSSSSSQSTDRKHRVHHHSPQTINVILITIHESFSIIFLTGTALMEVNVIGLSASDVSPAARVLFFIMSENTRVRRGASTTRVRPPSS